MKYFLILICVQFFALVAQAQGDIQCDVTENSHKSENIEIRFKDNCRSAIIVPVHSERIIDSQEIQKTVFELVDTQDGLNTINLSNLSVDGDLNLSNINFSHSLNLEGMKLVGDLNLSNSKNQLPINLTGAEISGTLLAEDAEFKAFFASKLKVKNGLVANGMIVSSQLLLSNSDVSGGVHLNNVKVGGHALLNDSSISGGLIMESSRVEGQVYLEDSKISHGIWMQSIVIKEMMIARNLSTDGIVSLVDSSIGEQIDLSGAYNTGVNLGAAQVGSNFLMRNATIAGNLKGKWLRVQGQIDLESTEVNGELDFEEVAIGSSLLMRKLANPTVDFRGIQIGDQLDMSGATLREIRMSESIVSANLLAYGISIQGTWDLSGARLGGQLTLINASVTGDLLLENITVRDNTFLKESKFDSVIAFVYSEVDGGLDLSASKFSKLVLTGTKIAGEFRIGSVVTKPWSWDVNNSELDLRGVDIGGLEDFPVEWVYKDEVWPNSFLADGFTFKRLTAKFSDVQERDANWYENFLRRIKYSPHTYDQFSDYFDGIGETSLASDIRYLSSDRRLSEATKPSSKLGLFFSKIFVGYGERLYLAIFWALGFIFLGWIVLLTSQQNAGTVRRVDFLFYSFDRFIPFIVIDKTLMDNITIRNSVRYYFYVHAIMGYIVGVFVAAAIGGLAG